MAIQNLTLVLKTLNATFVAAKGNDAGAESLGQRMPAALSQVGRPMSPGFERSEAYPTSSPVVVRTVGKAAGITPAGANLPGKSVRSRDWALPITWATTSGSGRSAWTSGVSGRADSDRHACHHQTSGHDYPSHDRRDDSRDALVGSALGTNHGK
jgi:hypothetical protein